MAQKLSKPYAVLDTKWMINMMKKWPRLRSFSISPATTSLAVSYLAIIMLLSVSFSALFYWTSTKGLDIQKKTPPVGKNHESNAQDQLVVGINNNGQPQIITASSEEDLQAQFQDRIADIRTTLMQQLVALNGVVFIGGAVLSLYLARRTLRPIETAVEAQQRFAADASHELRTPLTIMQTEIEVVLGKKKLSVARARSALQSNYQEVVRLRQLSEGLLQLARSVESIPEHQYTTVPLDEIVNDAVNQVMKLALAKRVSIHTNVPRILAKGEYQSILQTIVILLDNAIKYSSRGANIFIDGEGRREYVYLHVRDEGPGMRDADLRHIFERFYRANSSEPKKETRGYGLGLSIAKRLVEQQGGTITVNSALGKGSTFTLKFPRHNL